MDFGLLGLSFPPLHLVLPLILLPGLHPRLFICPASGLTCMSEPPATHDLRQLTSAVQQLTVVAESLSSRNPQAPIGSSGSSELAWHKHWFVVRESSVVPFVPLKYLKNPPKLEVESGPPPLPDFCVTAIEKDLNLASDQARTLSSEAFTAGFWARVSGATYTKYTSSFRSQGDPKYWLLRRAPGFSHFVLVQSEAESAQLAADCKEVEILEVFPSLAEVKVFCVGACICIPPIWTWSDRL